MEMDTLQKAKELPGVFNNRAVFYKSIFEPVNLSDVSYIAMSTQKMNLLFRFLYFILFVVFF